MRIKHKKPLAIALTVTAINLLILIYDEYTTSTSADILKNPAVFDSLGPGLPPDYVEEMLTQQYRAQEIPQSNAISTRNSSILDAGMLNSTAGIDKVLIHSYLLSGASTVAEALNLHHKEVFYVHHPLKALEDSPTSRFGVLDNKRSKEALDWLKAIYNCSFRNYQKFISEPEVWKSHSIRNTFKYECQNNKQVLECMERTCKQRLVRAISTVRLGMDYIYQMMKSYGKKMKVILVVSDPRSILSKRQHQNTPLENIEEFKQHASRLCRTMGSDILYSENIQKVLPGSILILHYEHFLLHPRKMLSYLYNFLGLDVPVIRIQEILKVLGLQVPEEQLLQMTKSWQVELTLQESRAIDHSCNLYYKKLGYFPVPSKLMANDKYFIGFDQMEHKNDE